MSIFKRHRSDHSTPVAVLEPDQARRAQAAGALMVDVREADEWAEGHVAGAVHRPVGDIEADPRLDSPADTAVVTYCKVGARAARAAAVLAAHGYADVSAMTGGFDDWAAAGYPAVYPDDDDGQ